MCHLKYLRYVIVHKWFVMLGCFRRGRYWQGIVHDWSKFLPSEWFPYVESFYGERSRRLRDIKKVSKLSFSAEVELVRIQSRFDSAWLMHQHRNPHHWQHWVLREDSGATKILDMPARYRDEMLADWEGAGRAITGKAGGTRGWYLRNRERILLAPSTREYVETQLGIPSWAMHGCSW